MPLSNNQKELEKNQRIYPDQGQTFRDRITGTKVAYYFVCKRKLWLFSHNITFEQESEDVKIGKQIGRDSYSNFKKDIQLDQAINLDFIRSDGKLVVHEIKKSSKLEESHCWQLLYYLYYLKKRGVSAVGELDYPTERKKVEVNLSSEKERKLETAIQDMNRVSASAIPGVIDSPICKKCAYFEFCYGDVA